MRSGRCSDRLVRRTAVVPVVVAACLTAWGAARAESVTPVDRASAATGHAETGGPRGAGRNAPFDDCNGNEIPDELDIAEGTSQDCQPDGIPDECQLDGPPLPWQHAFESSQRIPPSGTAGTTVDEETVGETGTVVDVDVTVNILHEWDDDLIISLEHEGVTVLLSHRNGRYLDDYLGTIFDDDAEIPVSEGEPPFTGRFIPEEPLAGFHGLDQSGMWRLIVEDVLTGDTGTLLDWTLDILTEGVPDLFDCQPNGIPDECEPDTDGDNAIDECDDCPSTPGVTAPSPEGDDYGNCSDGLDNDCDGFTDGDDAACTSVPSCACGDIAVDGQVNLLDFATLAVCFGPGHPDDECPPGTFYCADLDGDGQVNLQDVATFAALFGEPASGIVPDCGP